MAAEARPEMITCKAFKEFLIHYLCPDAYVDSVCDIDLGLLWEKGYNSFILDLDNTLVGWRSQKISEKVDHWLKEAEKIGYRRHIVSNSLTGRVSRFSNMLGIPYISKAVKPRKKVFLEALEHIGARPEQTVVIGDQLFTDILGGKRMGFFTILVSPVDKHEFLTTLFLRVPEKAALAFFRKQGLLKGLS